MDPFETKVLNRRNAVQAVLDNVSVSNWPYKYFISAVLAPKFTMAGPMTEQDDLPSNSGEVRAEHG